MAPSISTVTEAEEFLRSLLPNSKLYKSDGLTLDRMWPLLKAVGNPHEKVRAVHIAGTSGKTSTAYYVDAFLRASGKKTVLTVSPHLSDVRERLQIEGKPISEDLFCEYLNQFLQYIDIDKEKPSYFELFIVFVLWVSMQEAVDYVVLETGLGGKLDSTNVVTRSDKVCVLTDIGFDHTEILGNTLPEIASQKAGIMLSGNVAFTHQQPEEVLDVFRCRAEDVDAKLHVIEPQKIDSDSSVELFQQRNLALAKAACQHIAERDGFELALFDTKRLKVPGRMELIEADNGSLILDGAHNQQKMQVFAESFKAKFPGKQAHFLIAMKQGKDMDGVMEVLQPLCASLLVTSFQGVQDAPFSATDPRDLAKSAQKHGISNVEIFEDQNAALKALQRKEGVKVITGSLYLIANLRRLLVRD